MTKVTNAWADLGLEDDQAPVRGPRAYANRDHSDWAYYAGVGLVLVILLPFILVGLLCWGLYKLAKSTPSLSTRGGYGSYGDARMRYGWGAPCGSCGAPTNGYAKCPWCGNSSRGEF
jgi:hypothetical protein